MYGGKLLFLSSYQNQVSGKRLYALCFQCCLSLSMSSLSPLSDAAKLSKGSFQARWCFTVGGGRAETPRRLPPAQFSLARWYLSPGGSDGKASTCNVGDLGSIPGLGRSSGEGNGNPLQYSYLENPMDRKPLSTRGCRELDTTQLLSMHTCTVLFKFSIVKYGLGVAVLTGSYQTFLSLQKILLDSDVLEL